MGKRCLDTNILINHFLRLRPLGNKTVRDAEAWAHALISERSANVILSPMVIEFLCGILDQNEVDLREAYLKPFLVMDRQRITVGDWREARRIAKYAGAQAKRRSLGDCLITAIADRLKLEIISEDQGLKRQRGRTRQRRP
jgi:predicted nucleic acid-binding protein